MPNFVYTAQQLYAMSEGKPFNMPIKRWKLFVFQKRREDGKKPLNFQKGKAYNSSYKVKGENFIKFVSQF